jgi:DNA ligase-1
MKLKPMLAETLPSMEEAKFPIWATPKLDGIRCLTADGGRHGTLAVSRSLKPIPNAHVRETIEKNLPAGLDGELIIPGAIDFGTVSSAIMCEDGKPNFRYVVFDCYSFPHVPYTKRVEGILTDGRVMKHNFVTILKPSEIKTLAELTAYEEFAVGKGYEGVMLRSGNSPYKFGRSTLNEGYLLKLKRFEDSEATVIGYEEFLHNDNVATKNALGRSERSSHKNGLRPGGMLGSLLVEDDGVQFSIGTGFTEEQRKNLWVLKDALIGRKVKYRFQPSGAKEKPRFPSFIGFRDSRDL